MEKSACVCACLHVSTKKNAFIAMLVLITNLLGELLDLDDVVAAARRVQRQL